MVKENPNNQVCEMINLTIDLKFVYDYLVLYFNKLEY